MLSWETRGGGVDVLAGGVSVAALALVIGAACAGDPTPDPGNGAAILERGEAIYVQHCQSCHGDREGQGSSAGAPPHNVVGHTWHHPDAQLLDWIRGGRPDTAMSPFGEVLTDEEMRAILAFIATWWTDEQRETQADISEPYQEALDRQRGAD